MSISIAGTHLLTAARVSGVGRLDFGPFDRLTPIPICFPGLFTR